jgi:alkyl sulfatase BDS1-like metallo-beta-lactamase superfamily hydrolase
MRRRAMFQFGPTLERGPRSHVDSGLGKVSGRGTVSLIAPNKIITEPTERHVIDGFEIVFQLTPETEAPAEMNFFFPQERVLNLAENGCHTMHNLCPIRGAKTRDSLAWSKYLDQALDAFIDQTDICIAQHHWPTWGQAKVRRFIEEQRDMYRYLHDQTLRLMSHGLTPNEIAEGFTMPASLRGAWHTRPYYGAIAHNVRAVYAHYLGPYDGNPVNLNPLSPQGEAVKYLEYMGGADAVLSRARRDFDAGDYRWVVQVTHHVVFADPANREARELGADALEQLGYQSESSPGAMPPAGAAPRSAEVTARGAGGVTPRVVAMLPMPMFFDYLAIRVNEKAAGLALQLDWRMAGGDSPTLNHCALSHGPGSHGGARPPSRWIARSGCAAGGRADLRRRSTRIDDHDRRSGAWRRCSPRWIHSCRCSISSSPDARPRARPPADEPCLMSVAHGIRTTSRRAQGADGSGRRGVPGGRCLNNRLNVGVSPMLTMSNAGPVTSAGFAR